LAIYFSSIIKWASDMKEKERERQRNRGKPYR